MNGLEIINMIWYFVNPFNVMDHGWIAIIDVLTFIIVPYVILKKFYKVAWWRSLVFYTGFILTQISMNNYTTLEYFLEVGGVLLITYACLGCNKKYRKV